MPRNRPLARPWYNSSQGQGGRHPPGLRGKEIGMYYRSLSLKKKMTTEPNKVCLRIPEKVVKDIYRCLDKIEEIAIVKNIYVPPVTRLTFVAPPCKSDFIPLVAQKSETITHEISNIRKREDDDVVFVKSIDPDVTEVVDVSMDDVMDLTSDSETNPQISSCIIKESKVKNEQEGVEDCDVQIKEDPIEIIDVKSHKPNFRDMKQRIKEKRVEEKNSPPHLFYIDTKPSTNVSIKSETSNQIKNEEPSTSSCKKETDDVELTGLLVSNNYITNRLSTSKSKTNDQSNKYKYSYDDIITGTFEEKLDESLKKGIEITKTDLEVERLNKILKQNQESMMKTNDRYKRMLEFRQTLPTYKKGPDLLEDIESNQVIVISGETGCGKSTQVPQLILDKAIASGKGANVKILVTEPRRIAASSLAVRVADERGEKLGCSVGYCVRLESVSCRDRGSIKYCTTGVLLAEMEQEQALGEYSHVILDEVHERDAHIDIAMCMLRQILKKRKDLKLILMSATLDAEALSEYFDGCPLFHIEGLAYPVHDVYMEDILQLINFRLPTVPDFLREPKMWRKHAYKNRDAVYKIEREIQYKASIEPWIQSIKKLGPSVFDTLTDYRIEELNLDLILELLKYISKQPPGAILVFLPGIGEITKLLKLMRESRAFDRNCDIYSLHSKLPSIDQNKVFERPPFGVRKIIVATNIAETSITIDDVVYVIDCGKMKYKGLDVEKNFATLQNEWVSKANMRQRRGRAGRCQPGICYHLVTSYRAQLLPDRLIPELQRSNLLEEVLCIKRLRLGKAEKALQMMPAVPAEKTIKMAIKHLQQVGALDERETLTPMGWHLARLPVPPAAGKLLVLGALFGCLDRAASLAAAWGFKDPFQLVIGKQIEADAKKRELAMSEPSDHVAISEAIMQWERSKDKQKFAWEYFLSDKTLEQLSSMKVQFAHNLKEMGFLSYPNTRSQWENRHDTNMSLFKAIVAAALYPNVASVTWLKTTKKRPMSIKAHIPEDGRVAMHPSSVMHTNYQRRGWQFQSLCANPGANWLVYGLKQKSSDLFLLDVTCVYTLPLLFFGDLNLKRAEKPDECLISILSYNVHCKKETAELLYRLRSLLDQVLTYRIGLAGEDCKKRIDFDQEVLSAVIDLITAEDEGVQYLGEDYDDAYNE